MSIATPPRSAPGSSTTPSRLDPDAVARYWAYLYLMRVPLLVWLVMTLAPPLAVPEKAPLGPMLRGLFDLAPDASAPRPALVLALGCGLVALFAWMAAAALAVCARLILLGGEDRFGAGPVINSPGIKLSVRLVPMLAVASLLGGVFWQTRSAIDHVPGGGAVMASGFAVGTALFVLVAMGAAWLEGELPRRLAVRMAGGVSRGFGGALTRALLRVARGIVWLASLPGRLSPKGYLDSTGTLLDRHVFALSLFLVFLLLYVVLFVGKGWYGLLSEQPVVPTLCLALALLIVLTWLLSAVTFFLDRFRVPVLVAIAAYGWAVSVFAGADSFFLSKPAVLGEEILPRHLLAQAESVPARADRPPRLVLAAATGGGIQAAAWTARVLAGLADENPVLADGKALSFGQALKLVSAVSGGSVGAMFILDCYRDGRLVLNADGPDACRPVENAERSSLDQVAWGIAYPDLVFGLLPMLRVSERSLTTDRGSALEHAWRRTASLRSAKLADWRDDVRNRRRPGVIFNATLVESGKRLLISTVALGDPPPPMRDDAAGGRMQFHELYPGRDIDVATAARLSATFPIVSPASRILKKTAAESEFHVVDGGYNDNYGVASLAEWLDHALAGTASLPDVLLVEIRSFPVGREPEPTDDRGWLFQAGHPIMTLVNVRGAGQLSHNELDVRLLQRWRSNVRRVTFTFTPPPRGEAPLSWHLTPEQKQALAAAWNAAGLAPCKAAVRSFLAGDPVETARC